MKRDSLIIYESIPSSTLEVVQTSVCIPGFSGFRGFAFTQQIKKKRKNAIWSIRW